MRQFASDQVAEEVNTLVDNIGARRLHTILERILEEISFSAPEQVIGTCDSARLADCACAAIAGCSVHAPGAEHW